MYLEKKMSFEDVRNALVITYADGFLNDEEFLILYDYYEPANPPFPYWNFDPFCLDAFDSCECEAHFTSALRIPPSFKCPPVVWKDFVYF